MTWRSASLWGALSWDVPGAVLNCSRGGRFGSHLAGARAAKAAREPRQGARRGVPAAGAQRGLSAPSAAGCRQGGAGSRQGASWAGRGGVLGPARERASGKTNERACKRLR